MKNERSFLKSLISGYLVVGLIAVIAIVVLNVYSQEIFKEYILTSNKGKLEKMTSHVETVLAEMKENCIDISSDANILTHVKNMSDTKESAYDKYQIKQLLNAYGRDKYFDVFIYFPESDYIVSARKSSLSSKNYYMAYFSNEQKMSEDFQKALCSESGYPTMGSMCTKQGDTYVYFSMKSNSREQRVPFTTFVILEPDSMVELTDDTNLGSNVVLFDRDNNLLYNRNKDNIPYNMDLYDGSMELHEIEIDSDTYIMQLDSFKGISGYLGSVTSTELFWQQFSQMRVFSLSCIAVFICTAVVISYVNSKRQEKPLTALARDFERGVYNDESEGLQIKEFSLIRDMFFKEYQEKKQLYEVVKNTRKDRKGFLLRRLLEGVDVGQIERENVLEKAGIHFKTNWFVVGVIRIENMNGRDELDAFIVSNVFEEIFNHKYVCHMIQMDTNNQIFILNLCNKLDVEKISSFLEEGKRFINSIFNLQVTVAYSDVHEGMCQIKQAYGEAKQAMEYRYLLGKESEIFYPLVANRPYAYEESDKVLPMLQAYIKSGKEKGTPKDFILRLLSICKINQTASIKTVESFKMQIIQFINTISTELDYSAENKNKCIAELLNQSTMEEFTEYLGSLLEGLRQANEEQSDEKDICTHARKYIAENFCDSQLGVESVAAAVCMSASYLSKNYKSKFGISIAQDITNFRMQKAKELLQETSLNINVIAEKTGFSDNIVFSKAFKKIEGITPGEYRKQNFKEKN